MVAMEFSRKLVIRELKSYETLTKFSFHELQEHKQRIISLQKQLKDSKQSYSSSLKKLEGISDEIHEMRRSRSQLELCLSPRQDGVGAESPSSSSENAFADCSDITEMKRKLEASIDAGSIDGNSEEHRVETTTTEQEKKQKTKMSIFKKIPLRKMLKVQLIKLEPNQERPKEGPKEGRNRVWTQENIV